MTTCAPRSASAMTAARPMPREPPVTSATLPLRSNILYLLNPANFGLGAVSSTELPVLKREICFAASRSAPHSARKPARCVKLAQKCGKLRDGFCVGHAQHAHPLVDTLGEAGQNLARADLEGMGDPGLGHERDGLLPENGPVNLPDEQAFDSLGILVRKRGDVRDHWKARCGKLELSQRGFDGAGSGGHQCTVKRRAHLERNGLELLGAGQDRCAIDGSLVTRNHD